MKLRPPGLPPDYVPRLRIHERLDDGSECRLTLVCAAAGFGKSIALAGWLQEAARSSLWINLDEFDSDLASFASLLASALESARPGAGRPTLAALERTEDPDPTELNVLLADALMSIEDELIVVLDDYQEIRAPSVHVLMSLLLRRLPPGVQLVIASREEPPLPIPVLRARRQLAEVHADDLRFTRSETSALLADGGGSPLDPRVVAEAVEQTEGWAVGLRMFTVENRLAPRHEADVAPMAPHQRRFADAYLLEEVLARQTPELRRFLMQTSVLERLHVPLIEAIVDDLQPGDAQRLLHASVTGGLFLVALDDEQRWYRYHGLFRDMLRRCLERECGADYARALVRQAVDWLEANGLFEEAATSALAAGDALRAASLVERLVPTWQRRELLGTLDLWLRRLPPEVVATSPVLSLARCRLVMLRCEFGALEAELRRLETMLTQSTTLPLDPASLAAALGQINASFIYVLHMTGGDDWEALGRALLAFRQLPADQIVQRGATCQLYAITLQCLGRTDEALAWLRSELGNVTALHPTMMARLLNAEAYVEFSSGRLDAATHTARQLVAFAHAADFPVHLGWGHYLLGRIAYEWNDLADAREHFNAVLNLGDDAHRVCAVNAACGLALSLAALGKHGEAEHLVLRELARAEEYGNAFFVMRLRSFLARLALASSDVDQASHWLAGVTFTQRAISAFELEDPRLTQALVLVSDPTGDHLSGASSAIERALDAAQSRHVVSSVVKGLAIRALIERSRGEMSAAFTSITDALTIAAPGRFIRSFVDLGPPLMRLLVELAGHGGLPKGADRVLEACRAEAGLRASSLPDRSDGGADGAVSLTWRELDVLHLLDGRHTNREIAQFLSIAEETVKKHAVNIYAKLHVTGRREAVARAYTLGLLTERDLRPPTLA